MNPHINPHITPHAPLLALAVAAAQRAAAHIRQAASDPAGLQVRAKRPNDFVTQVDLASERLIVDTLLGACPDHAVRSEEAAAPHGNPQARHLWIVDPLDGTANFIHGWPAYAVSIALAVDGQIELGVVLDVPRGECFTAMRSGGAWCDGLSLKVSGCASLDQALLATSCPPLRRPVDDPAGFAAAMALLGDLMATTSAVRRSGSAALDLAWTAAGRCDAMADRGLAAWDVAAGALLVQEAGGRVSTFGGGPGFVDGRECAAANSALHAALLAVLAPHAGPHAEAPTQAPAHPEAPSAHAAPNRH